MRANDKQQSERLPEDQPTEEEVRRMLLRLIELVARALAASIVQEIAGPSA